MRQASSAVLCAALFALVGCATATHYTPAARPGGPGFSEQQIEEDRWRVAFVTGDGASPDLARDYALLRAAELTLAKGGTWFAVTDRSVEPVAARGPRIGIGVGGADFGRHSAVGGSVGTGFGGEAGAAASLEIVIGRGPRPGATVPTPTTRARSPIACAPACRRAEPAPAWSCVTTGAGLYSTVTLFRPDFAPCASPL